jgi:hypothetical protein
MASLGLTNPSLVAQDVDRILEILGDVDLAALETPPDAFAPPSFIDPAQLARWLALPTDESDAVKALVDPEFHLRDGGLIQGRLVPDMLPLRTLYGTLEIPIEKLIEVRFFVQPSLDVRDQIQAAVSRLGDPDFGERESASAALRELFPDSLPYLREALGSKDEEIREQSERLVAELDAWLALQANQQAPILDGQDTVLANESSMRGVVERELFVVETSHGRLEVPRHDLVRIVFRRRTRQSAETVVPSTALASGNWMKTPIQLFRGKRLKIEANGQMQVPNWGEACGPEGSRRQSRAFPGHRMLALVGRIGESGETFQVGRSYEGRANRTGVLYLAVIPFRWAGATGAYKVAIEAR